MLAIRNGSNLSAAITELKMMRMRQKMELGRRFSNPRAIFRTLGTLFPRSGTNRPLSLQQWLRPAIRFALPMLLIRTLFKRKSYFFKALVGLTAKKAATYIH
jgi:hypothetical protein